MTKTKEKIKAIVLKPDGSVDHTTERMGTVYKKKDGKEWAHHGKGYLLVSRDSSGLATVEVKPHGHRHHAPPPQEAPAPATPTPAPEINPTTPPATEQAA